MLSNVNHVVLCYVMLSIKTGHVKLDNDSVQEKILRLFLGGKCIKQSQKQELYTCTYFVNNITSQVNRL